MEKNSAKRILLIVLCCVLAVALAAVLVITIVTNHLLDQIQHPEDTTLSSSEIEEILNANSVPTTMLPEGDTGTEPTETQSETQGTEETKSDEVVQILLIGQMADTAASWNNAEVMILCAVNKTAKTLTMTSFRRDAVAQIPGYGSNKLSVAYAIGGMKLLDQCLEENYGVMVDANIAVNFEGLIKLVDMVGGIQLQLTADEANYLNYYGNWGITSSYGWALKEGENTLTGPQAMGYVMIKITDEEAERTQRQRNVISALVEQAKKLSVAELYDLVEEGLPYVSTDMTDSEILGYIAELAPLLTELKLVS